MLKLIRKLYRTRLLTPIGLFRLLEAVLTTGINLMALLRIAAKLHPQRTAIIDDRSRLSYSQLWEISESLAVTLQAEYGIQRRQNVAIACRNHAAAIYTIFAVSRLGVNTFLFNPEMSADQIKALIERQAIDFYIYDHQDDVPIPQWLQDAKDKRTAIQAYHSTDANINLLASKPKPASKLKAVKTGSLVVMTGGTTGQPKPASRKPSIFNFLPPFIALLNQVQLDNYRSVYIATPIYHGFGLAALLIGIVLGASLYVTERFEAEQACTLISKQQIEVVTLVPLMLQRMLKHDPDSLSSVRRILSGGAALNQALASATLEKLGLVLFNLYGTSEAGFCILATPELLSKKPASIGQPVWGVSTLIANDAREKDSSGKIGQLLIRSAWSTSKQSWVETGDLAYQDAEGDLFLCGRVDDMVVSGGENVYPIELENILIQHPEIESVAVVGIPDEVFGQRLKAVVVLKPDAMLTLSELQGWLKPRVARYQMPAIIEWSDALPYTTLGKIDKQALR